MLQRLDDSKVSASVLHPPVSPRLQACLLNDIQNESNEARVVRDEARTPSSDEQDTSPSAGRGRESSEKGFQVKGPVIAQGSSASKSTSIMHSLFISLSVIRALPILAQNSRKVHEACA